MGQIIPITYNGDLGFNKNIKEVFDFLHFVNWDVNKFLDFKNPKTELKNRDIIWALYSKKTLLSFDFIKEDDGDKYTSFDSGKIQDTHPCPVPITFYVDSKYILQSNIIIQSNLLVNNFSASDMTSPRDGSEFVLNKNLFYLNEQGQLTSTKQFDGSIKSEPRQYGDTIKYESDFKDLKRRQIEPHVYIWCKSLQLEGKFNSNSIFDLSPFIQTINTSVSETGGNFSIQLVPVEGYMSCSVNGEIDGIWHPKTNQHIKFDPKGKNPSVQTEHYFKTIISQLLPNYVPFKDNSNSNVDLDTLITGDETRLVNKFTKMLFEHMISSNDVLFISFGDPFEKSGKENILKYIDDFFLDYLSIAEGQYEMIGLVDTNSISHTPENTDITINITGRDCMKLLIEDGTYFFNKSYANPDETSSAFNNVDLPNQGDSANSFNNAQEKPLSVNRLLTTGILDVFYNPSARNVDYVMNLLMSRLANIEICPSQLFDAWGDRRTKFQIAIQEPLDEKGEQKTLDGE